MAKSKKVFLAEFDAKGNLYLKKIDEMEAKTKKTVDNISKNVSKTEAAFNRVAGSIASIGAAYIVGQGIQKVTRELIDLDTGLRNINTIIRVNDKSLEGFKEQLIEMKRELGITEIKELTDAFYQAVSAGIPAGEAIDFVRMNAKAAKAGLTDITTAVDGTTTILNAFHKSTSETNSVLDVTFKTVELGKTTFEEFAASASQWVSLAAALKVSFEDNAAAIATMTKQGTDNAQAATILSAVYTAVLNGQERAATMGGKVAKAFSLESLATKGLQTFLVDLNTELGGSKIKMQELLGRAEAVRGMLMLTGENAAMAASDLTAMKTAAGSMSAAFDEQTKSIEHKANRVSAALETVGMAFINHLAEPVSWVLENFAGGMDVIFSKMKDVELSAGALDAAMEALQGTTKEYREQELEVLNKAWDDADAKMTALMKRVNQFQGGTPAGANLGKYRELDALLKSIGVQSEAIAKFGSPVTDGGGKGEGGTPDIVTTTKTKTAVENLIGRNKELKKELVEIDNALKKKNLSAEIEIELMQRKLKVLQELSLYDPKLKGKPGTDAIYENTKKDLTGVTETSKPVEDFEDTSTTMLKAGEGFHDSLEGAASAAMDVSNALNLGGHTFVAQMAQALSSTQQIANALYSIINLFGGGGSPIGLFLKGLSGKAMGGYVSGNTPYVVGERGPELFLPNKSGYVVPNFELPSFSLPQTSIANYNSNFSDKNIVTHLQNIEGRFEAMTMSMIKVLRDMPGNGGSSRNLEKVLTNIVTKQQGLNTKNNIKLKR